MDKMSTPFFTLTDRNFLCSQECQNFDMDETSSKANLGKSGRGGDTTKTKPLERDCFLPIDHPSGDLGRGDARAGRVIYSRGR